MQNILKIIALSGASMLSTIGYTSDDVGALAAKGKELYFKPASCALCHGNDAEGGIGPNLQYGPSAQDILYQLDTNPQMAPVRGMLQPTDEDLIALSLYLKQLSGADISMVDINSLRQGLNKSQPKAAVKTEFPALTPFEQKIVQIESWADIPKSWQRKAKTGNIKKHYDVKVLKTYEPGEPKFKPQPGKTYFYENTGYSSAMAQFNKPFAEQKIPPRAKSSAVVVGDAETKKVIAHKALPVHMRGQVHTTFMSPDGKHVYIVGPVPVIEKENGELPYGFPSYANELTMAASLLKVDALTLEPVKQLIVGARVHHGQIFQDRYVLVDTWARDDDAVDIFLMDPETDKIVGGIRAEELGGYPYTAATDNEYIYVLMEPPGYGDATGAPRFSGYVGGSAMGKGQLNVMRPFWVAKVDPKTWEVVQEYPYPGYRGDWIEIDSAKEYMYITAGASNALNKIDLKTGEVVWTVQTGPGPYGVNLNADETEVWVADKGEMGNVLGRTVTVTEVHSGRVVDTLFSGYKVDHILLAPNGKEFWATSNGEGRLYVFDALRREQTHVIDMPDFGDAHGLVWVHYDKNGQSKVVRDQGGFHNGINPRKGTGLDY